MAALTQIGDIRIFAELHRGVLTVVYKGYQQNLDRTVLVKVLQSEFADDAEIRDRFQQEARLIAQIQHPNVVTIFDYGVHAGTCYFAAEYIDGFNLLQLIQLAESQAPVTKGLPPELATFVLAETAKGLRAAHDKNILHGDIKPENILISHQGRVKLSDFGLARLLNTQSHTENITAGTLAYFSPEHISGGPLQHCSDIFSLGATFYEMLTGVVPFSGKTTNELFESILNDDPLPYLRKQQRIPEPLSQICAQMLTKHPDERLQNCDSFLTQLDSFRSAAHVRHGASELSKFMAAPHEYRRHRFEEAPSHQLAEPEVPTRRNSAIYPAAFALLLVLLLIVWLNLKQENEPARSKSVDIQNQALPETTGANGDMPQADSAKTSRPPAVAQPEPATTGPAASAPRAAAVSRSTSEAKEGLDQDKAMTPSRVRLVCTPWATVFVDGDSVGLTPLPEALVLKPGDHTITLRNPRFPPHEMQVNIKPGAQETIEFSFWSTVGTLVLDVSPWAEVYIDGIYRDTIPPQEHPIVVRPGRHKLALRHPALGEWQSEFEAVAGEKTELKLNLRTLQRDK